MNQIKNLRKKHNLTLKELSEEVGISADSLGKYERGERNPKIDKWEKLAKYFNVPVSYLQGISDIDTFKDTEFAVNTIKGDEIIELLQQAYIESLNKEYFSTSDIHRDADGELIVNLAKEPATSYKLVNSQCNKYFGITGNSDIDLSQEPSSEIINNTNYSLINNEHLRSFDFWKKNFSFLLKESDQNKFKFLQNFEILKILASEIESRCLIEASNKIENFFKYNDFYKKVLDARKKLSNNN